MIAQTGLKGSNLITALALALAGLSYLSLAAPSMAHTVEMTAYSAEQFPGQTASGPTTIWLLNQGGGPYLASNDYPFGTRLCNKLTGKHLGTVYDRMYYDNRIDVLVRTTE